jgi:hypothetical protein
VCTRGREHLLSRSAGRTYGTTREHGMSDYCPAAKNTEHLSRSRIDRSLTRTESQAAKNVPSVHTWHAGRPDPTGPVFR